MHSTATHCLITKMTLIQNANADARCWENDFDISIKTSLKKNGCKVRSDSADKGFDNQSFLLSYIYSFMKN